MKNLLMPIAFHAFIVGFYLMGQHYSVSGFQYVSLFVIWTLYMLNFLSLFLPAEQIYKNIERKSYFRLIIPFCTIFMFVWYGHFITAGFGIISLLSVIIKRESYEATKEVK